MPPLLRAAFFFVRLSLSRSQFLCRNPVVHQSRSKWIAARSPIRSSPLSPPLSPPSGDVKIGPLVNEEIPSNDIHVVGSDGKLGPPQRLLDVLASIDRSLDFLVQVSPGTHLQPLPVCKILNKKAWRQETRDREKEKAKVARLTKNVKQLELNWAIDSHDLSHRLRQLADFLNKGRRVEIVLVQKRRKRHPTNDEVNSLMASLTATLEETGAMHVKDAEGAPGHRMVMTIQKNSVR